MLLMMKDPYSSSSPSWLDVTFSSHNDPVGYPTDTPLKRKEVANLYHDDTQTPFTDTKKCCNLVLNCLSSQIIYRC